MNRALALVPAALMIVGSSSAQAPDPWLPLLIKADEGVHLRWQVERLKDGWQIQIKNVGTQPIHFGFHLDGPQQIGDAARNGRIHLVPGMAATPFIAWAGEDPAGLPEVKLSAIRLGVDEGPFWRE